MRFVKTVLSLLDDFRKRKSAHTHILDYPTISVVRNSVNLHFFHSQEAQSKDRAEANLGDELSPLVVDWMCARFGFKRDKHINETRHLYAIGSILLMGHQNATVWGTGLPYRPFFSKGFPHRSMFRELDIRCVRGPLTRSVLRRLGHECPEVYGDPAVLMPMIYKPRPLESREVVFIPHYSKEHEMIKVVGEENIVSMRTDNYSGVIDKICSAKKVVSSSLHGIILAESYGIPAIFLQDRPDALSFKYEDWYSSTGRETFAKARTLDEALHMQNDLPSNIKNMQDKLLETFPKDLWY